MHDPIGEQRHRWDQEMQYKNVCYKSITLFKPFSSPNA